MMSSKFFSSIWVFIFGLIFLLLLYLNSNYHNDMSYISSDVWLYHLSSLQDDLHLWPEIPANYTNEPYYLAYPILNWAANGFSGGVYRFHIVAVVLLVSTYTLSGLIIFTFTRNWLLAMLAGVLAVVPRNMFFTQIGMLSFNNVRGLGFSFPFYFLLSYYWVCFGIENRYSNYFLGFVAGGLVYLYPPVGIVIVPLFILTCLLVRGRRYLPAILKFALVYLIVSAPFWYGHINSDNTGMLDQGSDLSESQLILQREMLDSRFHLSFFDLDFGKFKRSVWDGFPLLFTFCLSLLLIGRQKDKLKPEILLFTKVSAVFACLMIGFVFGIELVNWLMGQHGRPPLFIEHLRLLRVLVFIMVGQSVIGLNVLINLYKKGWWAVILSLVLILFPLFFVAPLVREMVRFSLSSDTREKYNLAPTIPIPLMQKSFQNLEQAAAWSSANISDNSKIFLFNDGQWEFMFKVLSHKQTNLTLKEGSVWVTSGFDNSLRWYQERQNYEDAVKSGDFKKILEFAQNLGCAYVLLPRAQFESMYLKSGIELPVLYQNSDYQILQLQK